VEINASSSCPCCFISGGRSPLYPLSRRRLGEPQSQCGEEKIKIVLIKIEFTVNEKSEILGKLTR
jgi:hypothetical protein